jgi:hypothetical protein
MKIPATILAFAAASVGANAQEAQTDAGAAAWARIYSVVSHPRCSNCHVGDSGRPGWDDLGYGAQRLHGMNIVADESRVGAQSIPCRTCHIGATGKNDVPHAAPQVDDAWRLPPVELAWRGKSSAEICNQLRNPQVNGGLDIAELIAHVRVSIFVSYGFNPGVDRVAAPGSVAELAGSLAIWGTAGMPCEAD